ncbi:MAG TPA: hypothetical protein VMT34_08295 [Aggregatilineales bacterium]|nr:hypothetical protein [Aggregatilineales bacterium]
MPQIGAIFYIAWGLLHLYAAFLVYKLGKRQTAGMVQGRIYQSVWNLAAFAFAVIAVAVVYNWFNNPVGYWLNLALTGVTDVGFILFVVVPGYLPLWPGLLGPALWILAVIFSTLGQWVIRA